MTKGKLQKKGYDYKPEFDRLQPIGEYGLAAAPYKARLSHDLDKTDARPWIWERRDFNPSLFQDVVHLWRDSGLVTQALYGPYHAFDPEASYDPDLKLHPQEETTRKTPIEYLKGNSYATDRRVRGPRDAARIKANGWNLATYGIVLNHMPVKICVVDVDDKAELAAALEKFGDTPLIFETKGGFHLYYLNPHGFPTILQEFSTAKIDFKACSMVAAPFSSFDREGGRIEWVNRPEDLDDYEALQEVIRIIRYGELPPVWGQALGVYFPNHFTECGELRTEPLEAEPQPETKTITPASFKAPTERPTVKANMNHESYKGPRQTKGVNTGQLLDGERGQGLWLVGCLMASRMPRNASILDSLIGQLSQHNALNCVPPKPESVVKTICKSVVKNHVAGRNYDLGGGAVIQAAPLLIPEGIKTALYRAVQTRSRNYKSTVDKKLIPLIRAIIIGNTIYGHFPLSREYLGKFASSNSSTRYILRDDTINAGIIEAVPLNELEYDKPWEAPTYIENEDGTKTKVNGRGRLYRFTAFARMLFAGDTQKASAADMQQAVTDLTAKVTQGLRSTASGMRYEAETKAKRKECIRRRNLFLNRTAKELQDKAAMEPLNDRTGKFESGTIIIHPPILKNNIIEPNQLLHENTHRKLVNRVAKPKEPFNDTLLEPETMKSPSLSNALAKLGAAIRADMNAA